MMAKRKIKSTLKMDIIKAFGADLDLGIRDSLFFVSENVKAVVYPIGHHIAIRDLFVREDMRKNDIMFIHNDLELKKITSMNVSRDNNLLLVCEKLEKSCCLSVYNLSKLNFNSLSLFKPKRKVISTIYSEFMYASFSIDGNYIASIGYIKNENNTTMNQSQQNIIQGIVWDIQIYQAYNEDNYKPRCIFDLPSGVTKITMENKIICTSGQGHLSFWYIYENSTKEFKNGIKNLNISNNNFIDHEWINGKIPMIACITDKNDIFILEGAYDKKDKNKKRDDDEDSLIRVEKFVIRQHIPNCFNDFYINACIIKTFSKGLAVGSVQGNILFLEKMNQGEYLYKRIRYTSRDKPAKVVGLSFNSNEENMVVGYSSNEICTINAVNLIENLNNESYDLKFNLVCDGFHQGPITCMDLALQRPIIVTTSNIDKTIRVWNYLTGHCEYCKIILTEKDNEEKEMDVLSVAIHPNGYYLAISDRDMIRFFHLCYKELRFYNNDISNNENPKSDCHLLKFSNGGHVLAAVSNKTVYIIRSYTRETLKIFDSPHTGTIKSIMFDDQDYFLYTFGSEGLIVQYNLFEFKIEKISSKYISYTGGSLFKLTDKTILMGCGLSAGKSVISEINMMEGENYDKQTFVTQVDQKLFSLIQIQSKRYDILGLAAGSKDGFVQLYPSPFSQYSDIDPWESVKSHRSTVTNIAYSRDTNLLFSTGEDGNLFIYCIYELPDGETISFEDNKINNFNQLTSILDEGLGDNVLYPLESIFNYEEEILLQNNLIADDKKLRGKLVSEHQTKLKELETKLSKQKEMELRSLEEKLKELKISKDATIDHYEDKIKNLINEQNRTLIEKEQSYNLRMDQMSNTIHDLTSQIHFLKNQHEIELKRKDDEYERKFRELEKDLRKKFEELKSNNDKLGEELNQRQRIEELKFLHLDQEHEQEISYKIEHYENLLAHEKKTIIESQNEISLLKDQKTKLEQEKVEQENENKKLAEEIERLTVSTHNLKNIIDKKDKDNDELKKKLQKSEGALQEKTILSGFSSKLKNELYKKNTEILSGYNRQQIDIGELKVNSKNTEKELEESMKLLENYEKELTKQRILIDELKNKCDDERKFARSKESDFDNLLNKIYETFQSNDKNKIIIGIRKIYTNYLTDEKMRKIESGRMNQNIRDELEKQIDFLQKSLISTIDIKGKRETIQHSEINKRTEHNSLLIEELNKNKKNYTILEKDYRKLKSDFSAMEKRQEKYLKMENDGIIPTSNKSPTLPSIKKNTEEIKNSVVNNDDLYLLQNYSVNSSQNTKTMGKLFKGNVLANKKENKEAMKLSDLMKTMEDKNNLIFKLKVEISRLNNEINKLSPININFSTNTKLLEEK